MLMKKYAHIYKPLLERVYEEERQKHKREKDGVKAAKAKLHTIFGAFSNTDAHKSALTLLEKNADEAEIMKFHASTRERLPYLTDFYGFIFAHIGASACVLDLGCGFNPFSLPWFPEKPKTYHALDIDTRTADLTNRYFALQNLPPLAACADLAVETPNIQADVVFLFKLLPVLEAQKRGRGADLLRELRAKHFVLSYPLKTLSGKEKGFKDFYAAEARKLFSDEFPLVAEKVIGNELIYILGVGRDVLIAPNI